MQQPVRPLPPNTGKPVDQGGFRPGTGPTVANRPIYNRPPNIAHNTVINTRPSWVNINQAQVASIHNNWHNAIVRPGVRPGVGLVGWQRGHPDRVNYWRGWGNSVRNNWGGYRNHSNWFSYNWWNGHPHAFGGWHYSWAFNRFPASYWWRRPSWPAFATWFTWGALPVVWTNPIYYDYGPGGNVVYQDNGVFVGGEFVGTPAEFAQSAADLATVPPPPDETVAQNDEWMPLGTFAMSTNENDVNSQRVLQLAVDRNGVISGTLFNQQTNTTKTVQGQVDKQTQRVAFRIGENDNVVAETGLYDLSQNEAPLLVHFGPDKVENYLLVRLDAPPDENGQPGQ